MLGLLLAALIVLRRAALPAWACLSFVWTAWVADRGLDARWPADADGADVVLTGWVDTLPSRDAGRTVFSLRVVSGAGEAREAALPRRVRLSWYDPAPAIAAGQALEVEARLRSPRGLVNPEGFDYERWLFLESYDATGYVRRGRVDPRREFGPAQSWLRFRADLAAELGRHIGDPDARALILALSLGERSEFVDRHWTVFQRTGTSHLVAVSGLHIGLIAAMSYALLLRVVLRLPYRVARHAGAIAAGSSLVPATIYAALAGFTLPTQRALIMLAVIQCLAVARRRSPLGSGLMLALIVIVVFDPLATLTGSFWLSFGAVTLLLAASSPLETPGRTTHGQRLAALGHFVRLQFALTIGLAPLVIWHFGQVSAASLFVNLAAIPVFGFVVVPLSLGAMLLAMTGVGIAPMMALAETAAQWAWLGLEWAAGAEYAAFTLARPSPYVVVVALAAIAMGVTRHRLPGRRLALLALMPLAADRSDPPDTGFARATVLDVGHGLAVAVDTATHRLLYDAGPVFRSGFDAGAEIVAPALRALGPKPLDTMILSHGDSDHAGGAAAILADYPDLPIIAGPDVDLPGAEPCVAGGNWTLDDVRFRFLHPVAGLGLDGNDSSCVLRIETRGGTLLLTGDIEARAERILTGMATDLVADVVVVPHHGSLTSSTRDFVAAVSPQAAIVSAAHNNRWNFPRPEVRRRWSEAGADVLVTGDHGAIRIEFEADNIGIVAMRHERHRYWRAERVPVSGATDLSAL